MGKILNFGELLLRLCPDAGGGWIGEQKLPVYIGGAELNVATALALWGVSSKYLTAVPDHSLSESILDHLNTLGIDTSAILKQGERLGTFYLTKGRDMKNAAVIYDRAYSSFSALKPGNIDWDKVLDGVDWLHFSAICPALNQDVADVCLEAVQAASKKNITISLDLNYRAKLWKYGKQPVEVMPGLAQYCKLIMGNIWAAEQMLGISINQETIVSGNKEAYLEQAKESSAEIMNRFSSCQSVANTFRFDQGEGIQYYTTLHTGGKDYTSKEHRAEKILDKVGSGDCFMAGLIYGFTLDKDPQQTLEFATAAAFDKLFIASDATTSTVAQINQRIAHAE